MLTCPECGHEEAGLANWFRTDSTIGDEHAIVACPECAAVLGGGFV